MRVDTDRMRRDAEAEFQGAAVRHREAIKAIELIERMARNGRASADAEVRSIEPEARDDAAAPRPHRQWESVRSAVWQALAHASAGLPKSGIELFIRENFVEAERELSDPRRLSRTLNRMHRAGEVRFIRPHRGTVPGIHALTNRTQRVAEETGNETQ
jgi:hypothetical protein